MDILRSAAILLVLVSHGRSFLPAFEGVDQLSNGGYFGVELFFVLSGFLIGKILIKIFEKENYSNTDLFTFWKRRWFRTLPNYFLFLILNAFVFSYFFENTNFEFQYLFFFQNFFWPMPQLMGESWSLAIEEWFYIFIPLALLIIKIVNKKIRLQHLILLVIIFSSIRYVYVFTSSDTALQWDLNIRKIVMFRLDSLLFGVIMAYLSYNYAAFFFRIRKITLCAGLILLAFCVYVYSNLNLNTKLPMTVLFSLTSLGFACLLPFFEHVQLSKKSIVKVFTVTSKISYSLYLIHFSFAVPYISFYVYADSWIVNYSLYWIICFVLAAVVYMFYEKPLTDLRNTK